jgi:ankyrin repeat protein
MKCSATGNVETVKALLAAGANANAKDTRQGHTALMRSVVQKHLDVARALLDGGADVNGRAKSGFTALMFAAQQGDLEAATMLVAAGANVNAATNEEGLWQGDTALLLATLSGHQALATFLLDQHADPNAADEYGLTALHFSILNGLTKLTGAGGQHLNRPPMTNLVKALLAHGADPNVRIKSALAANKFARAEASPLRPLDPTPGLVSPVGATPFLLATFVFDINLMRILAEGGADPLLGTEDNVTPLMVAATVGARSFTNLAGDQGKRALEALKLTVELGGDVNAADKVLGWTALHGAASSGSEDITKFLIEKGANVNARDKDGHTPLNVVADAQAAQGGAGLIRGYVKWNPTKDLLLKSGATPLPPGTFKDDSGPKEDPAPEK